LSSPEGFRPIADPQSAARFFHRFPDGVIGLGADRRVQFANSRAQQLLDGSALEVGAPLSLQTLAQFADVVLKAPEDVLTTRLALPDGRVLRVSGLGPQGAEPAMLILADVTAHEHQDRAMREFLRNAAHQLRTPLTAIATAVDVLQAGAKDVPAERDRFLEHIETHSERLIRIARGLLVLARAQSGEPMQLEIVDVNLLLEELAAEAKPRPDVEISVECEPGLAALAVGDLLHEALAALVDNAVEYTQAGNIRLTAEGHDGKIGVSVADSGAGIHPEHRERIFEPFYRPSAEGRGFGLGLAIAAEAARAMEGELTIDEARAGASFTISLTAAEKPA
jgi:signal transduction histidine kinase